MPNLALGTKPVGLWARTLDGAGGIGFQADRGAFCPRERSSRRLGARQLHAGGAGERCRFIAVLRACGLEPPVAMRRRSKAGGGNTAARHAVLRSDASRLFRRNGRHSRPMLPTAFLAALTTERCLVTRWAPTSICLPSSAYFGAAAQQICAEAMQLPLIANRASQGVQAPGSL